jgi:hypothetical protein
VPQTSVIILSKVDSLPISGLAVASTRLKAFHPFRVDVVIPLVQVQMLLKITRISLYLKKLQRSCKFDNIAALMVGSGETSLFFKYESSNGHTTLLFVALSILSEKGKKKKREETQIFQLSSDQKVGPTRAFGVSREVIELCNISIVPHQMTASQFTFAVTCCIGFKLR